jgi:hypothetical protein
MAPTEPKGIRSDPSAPPPPRAKLKIYSSQLLVPPPTAKLKIYSIPHNELCASVSDDVTSVQRRKAIVIECETLQYARPLHVNRHRLFDSSQAEWY